MGVLHEENHPCDCRVLARLAIDAKQRIFQSPGRAMDIIKQVKLMLSRRSLKAGQANILMSKASMSGRPTLPLNRIGNRSN